MALRNIRQMGDDMLKKKCREVKEMTPKLKQLVEDMLDTMYDGNGVGLAAPQVGILRRIAVVETNHAEDEEDSFLELVNPEIIASSGEQTDTEGCLSLPGKAGVVTRPYYVKIEAWDEDMEWYEMEAEDLLARAFCHEIDHLDGHMYVEKIEGPLHDAVYEDEDEE